MHDRRVQADACVLPSVGVLSGGDYCDRSERTGWVAGSALCSVKERKEAVTVLNAAAGPFR